MWIYIAKEQQFEETASRSTVKYTSISLSIAGMLVLLSVHKTKMCQEDIDIA